ncbi:hypothetical protein [Companilactobacillus muriivasis]|uniref:hypothetical protein n=1 Tax=Companilactobacillus muriivasis TaxID=3081444 RepID=UPI0030C6946A
MKRKFSFIITIAFILMDVVVAFLTQQAIISNLMGILIGIGLVIALVLITRVFKKWNLKRGKLVVAAVFFFLVLGRLVMTTLA